MDEIILRNNGDLPIEAINTFGKSYGFFEKLKMNGVGSPRFEYKSGTQVFDELNRNIDGEITYVNIEIRKKGLLLRAYSGQRRKLIGVTFEDLKRISLQPINVEGYESQSNPDQNPYYQITIVGPSTIQGRIDINDYNGFESFFSKTVFQELD